MLKSGSSAWMSLVLASVACGSQAQQAASRSTFAESAPLARIEPHRGAEAALRRLLAEVAGGKPDYELLSPAMAAKMREMLPAYQQQLRLLGELKSVRFANAMPDGADIFDVTLANGSLKCMVRLDVHGKLLAGDCREAPPAP